MITAETVSRLVQPNPAGIPEDLRKLPNWTCWKSVEKSHKPGEFDKIPINAQTGYNASSSDPSTWSDFDTAVAQYQSGEFDGVMFVTTADDGFILIDFDNCRDSATGELTEFATTWISRFDSFSEVSPSGTGLHCIIRGQKPRPKCKNTKLDIEVYDNRRFLCITGVSPDGTSKPVESRQDVLNEFFDEYFPDEKRPERTVETQPLPQGVDEQRIIEVIQRSKNAAKIIPLLQGNRDDYNGDWSSADQALCNHLAFYCDCEPGLMDKIFRSSGLMRGKWATIHSVDGLTYGEMTIQNAISRNSATYGWEKRDKKRKAKKQPEPQVISNGEPTELLGNFNNLVAEMTFTSDEATDRHNAQILIEYNGEDIRYLHSWKSWMIWDGTRWKQDQSGAIIKMAHSVSDHWFKKAHEVGDENQQKACRSHAQRSANTRNIESFLKQAQSFAPVSVSDLNSDAWLLNCQNGTVNLKTGELQPHKRSDSISMICPTDYVPDAQSMEWDSFLESTFAEHGDVIGYLQRLFGSALVGIIRDHILPVFWGGGANGKSTLLNAILETLGSDYSMQANPELLMETANDQHPTDRADLYGKRFVSAVETEAGKRMKESFVKGLTGGDRIRARHLYKDFFEFDPTHLITLCTNHKPRIYGDDYGIWRRLRLIPFVQTFKGSQADARLPEKLREESAGILAWMVRGCLDWQAQGLNEPQTVLAATEEYKSESDVIGQFIESECIVNAAVRVRFSQLYLEFETWCGENGESCPKQKSFGVYLGERFDKTYSGGLWYRGIALKA